MKITNQINEKIFREYDIRGIADTDLTDDVIYTIGRSYASYVIKNGDYKVIIGRDNRTSSNRIRNALIKGLCDSGINVIDLGLITTPMLYFARKYYNIHTAIMITASHNPKEYNGLKIAFTKVGNAYGKLIEDFKTYTLKGKFKEGSGEVIETSIKKAYLDNIKKSINITGKKVKVAVDCGNGTASTIIKDVLDMFDIDYELLYCESDPAFPNHVPDPAVSSNMIDLGKLVKEKRCDFGFGIDGDGDRVGIVLEDGRYITTDIVMLIIYRSIVNTMKNKKALFDVKCSRTLIDGLKELNLETVMNRTGNSYCNLRMQGEIDDPDDDFDFGGEYSGHLYFNDRYQGFDDGIYAGLRLIEICSNMDKPFSTLLDDMNTYYSTEEIKVPVTEDNKFQIVDKIKDYAIEKGYQYEDIDGIRVEFKDSWALVRASNTGPNLTVRFEAESKKRLDEIENEFMEEIEKYQ